jgi:peptidoglycan/LPS O-acetylase OafA/YrhL
MTTQTRTRLQDVALVALAVFCTIAAFLWAHNAFASAAFIGTAIICAAVPVGALLGKRNPTVWEARVGLARKLLWASAAVVIALFVLGSVYPA